MPIPSSNLILLVKDLNCPVDDDSDFKITLTAEEYSYSGAESLSCFQQQQILYRRRPPSCISQHKNVRKSHTCHSPEILMCISLSIAGIGYSTMWKREHIINQYDCHSIHSFCRTNSLTNLFYDELI